METPQTLPYDLEKYFTWNAEDRVLSRKSMSLPSIRHYDISIIDSGSRFQHGPEDWTDFRMGWFTRGIIKNKVSPLPGERFFQFMANLYYAPKPTIRYTRFRLTRLTPATIEFFVLIEKVLRIKPTSLKPELEICQRDFSISFKFIDYANKK